MTDRFVTLDIDNDASGRRKRSTSNNVSQGENPHELNATALFDGSSRTRRPESITDTDGDDEVRVVGPHTGVDDGLLPTGFERGAGERPHRNPSPRRTSNAFPSYDDSGFVEINGVRTAVPDVNAYQHKKTLAQGMMDLALLSANANQLRYVLETYKRHPYYYPSIVFISMSIIFQVAVGVGLILNGKYNIKNKADICRANRINNYTVIGIFVITVVNVFISAFGVADPLP
ncbi:ninjurin-1 isoform X1 [Glossina fuscipes]|uniref:Ninjurin-1 isoform X1 n=1 Tax=Glossina fuscipes TaxID=7396 RepID=A0A8U0W657_9MUSC|nr:ninjurin-1 isoform X1 [Glossina fuscipes]